MKCVSQWLQGAELLVFAALGSLFVLLGRELRWNGGSDALSAIFRRTSVQPHEELAVQGYSDARAQERPGARRLTPSISAVSVFNSPVKKPFYNLVYMVFSGDSEAAGRRRETLRQLYNDYGGFATANLTDEATGTLKKFSFRVIFVRQNENAPPEGLLDNDEFHVDVRNGYGKLAEKAKRMLAIVRHLSFDFLLKGDDDTFVCFNRLASVLQKVPEHEQGSLYAGVITTCGISRWHPQAGAVIMSNRHRWFDPLWADHTRGGLFCYPVYMQGAFYVLGRRLVKHLDTGAEHLVVFGDEGVSMGSWLLGTDRQLLSLGQVDGPELWHCPCGHFSDWQPETATSTFYHRCKEPEQLRTCGVSRGPRSKQQRVLC